MNEPQHFTSELQMIDFAQSFANRIQAGQVIYLQGPLGAGKTTFARALIQALGYQGQVVSPTFTIVEPYELPEFTLFHFDLYRIEDPQELFNIGIHDYFSADSVSLIEWPERATSILPKADIDCQITFSEAGRVINIF